MIPLSEVDVERIKKVRSGELWERGCGKTIEKMITLFSYLRAQNDRKQYLFIGENGWHTKDICRTFYYWTQEIGLSCRPSPERLSLIVKFEPTPLGTSFMDRLMYFLDEPKYSAEIRFDFTTPQRLRPWGIRGMRYDKIIRDLTGETYYKNRKILDEIRYMEEAWQSKR